jgi:hypothetical protein
MFQAVFAKKRFKQHGQYISALSLDKFILDLSILLLVWNLIMHYQFMCVLVMK